MIGRLAAVQRSSRLTFAVVATLVLSLCCLFVWQISRRLSATSPMDAGNRHRALAGCLPIRKQSANPNNQTTLNGYDVLLISSRRKPGQLVFPKGGVKRGERPEEAALRETWEEAGIRGIILANLANSTAAAGQQAPADAEIVKTASVAEQNMPRGDWFVLQVTEMAEEWPEREVRSRQWYSLETALKLDRVRGRARALLTRLADFLDNLHADSSESKSSSTGVGMMSKNDQSTRTCHPRCTLS